jgi:hypothetical protein
MPEYLMVVSSFALLLPARYALSAGRFWHAGLFVCMTVICAAYHMCDARVPGSLLSPALCPRELTHVLTLADHGCAYFCILQMSLLLWGPEDHNLHGVDHKSQSKKRWAQIPAEVLLHSRLLPVIAFLWFLISNSSWRKFHFRLALLWVVLCINGIAQFWLSAKYTDYACRVVTRAAFWRRLLNVGGLPLIVCGVLLGVMEYFESGVAHAIWHVAVATIACNIQRTVYYMIPDPVSVAMKYISINQLQSADVQSQAPHNPVMAHSLLYAPVIAMSLATTTCCLMSCMVQHPIQIPVLGLDTLEWQLGYTASIGSILTLAAFVGALVLITAHTDGEQSKYDHSLCQFVRASSCCGAIAILGLLCSFAAPEISGIGPWREMILASAVILLASSMVLTTLQASDVSRASTIRCVFAVYACILAIMFIVQLCRFHYLRTVISREYDDAHLAAHSTLSALQYVLLVTLALFPTTCVARVRAKWITEDDSVLPSTLKQPSFI